MVGALRTPQSLNPASARAALRANGTPNPAVVSARHPRVRNSVSYDVRIPQSSSQLAASAMFAASRRRGPAPAMCATPRRRDRQTSALLYFQIGHIMPDMNRKRTPDVDRWLPLQPRQFWILIVLSEADRHGYAILKAARAKAASGLGLGPTTLYRMLYRLVDEGLVEPTAAPATELDERRQYYGLTELGHAVLEAEVRRLERMVELGRTAVRRAATGGH